MIVEMRIYTLAFGTTARYFDLYRMLGQAVQWRVLGQPLGYYSTEIGTINQVVHLWRYSSFDERMTLRNSLWKEAQWLEFIEAVTPIVVAQDSRLMLQAPLDPVQSVARQTLERGSNDRQL